MWINNGIYIVSALAVIITIVGCYFDDDDRKPPTGGAPL